MIRSKPWLVPHAASLILLAPAVTQAAEWRHELAPYVWGAGMSGETGVGNAIADVDMSFADILEDLELGFMGVYRATKDRYSVTADIVFMGLGSTERGPGGVLKADIDMDQTAFEVDGGYEVMDRLTLLAGLRYVDLQVKTRITDPLGGVSEASSGENWVDPVVGALYDVPLSDAWSLMLRGDVGGFGVGSDFAWQAVAIVRWHVSPSFDLTAAYRYVDMDYENGDGAKKFVYDMSISGPAVGIIFKF